jgi:hypothetical protein
MPSYSLEEYPALQRWTGRSRKILIFTSLVSGIVTFPGIRFYAMCGNTGFFYSVLGPFLLTLVSFTISVYGYSYVFERYPLTTTWKERLRLHWVILFVASVLVCTSSYFAIINLGGPRCLQRKLQSDLMTAEKAFDEIVLVRRMEKSLLVPLSLAADKTGVLAEGEQKGTLSRKDGNGKVVANVTGLKRSFTKLADTLESSLAEHENEAAEGQVILEDIRGIMNDEQIGVRQRAALIVPLFNALNEKFTALKISAVPGIVSAVQNIDKTSLARGAYMDTAMEAIKTPIQKIKQEILKQVAAIKRQKEPRIPRFHVADEEQAIVAFPEAALFSIVFALSVDVGIPILCLACLFLIGHRETKKQNTFQGWSHGTSQSFGVTQNGAQPRAGHGSLWSTNNTTNRPGHKPGPNRGDIPEPPAA